LKKLKYSLHTAELIFLFPQMSLPKKQNPLYVTGCQVRFDSSSPVSVSSLKSWSGAV